APPGELFLYNSTMFGIELSTWEEFESKLKELREYTNDRGSQLLFRGQSDSGWPLTTTLDRGGAGAVLFSDYYRLISALVGPQVKTFAGVDVPEYSLKLAKEIFGDRELWAFSKLPASLYRYMVYLRHHGFPSPLLDWSRSPFVAAFFALREPLRCAEKRSVFAFCAMPKGTKSHWGGEPEIRHKRLGLSAHTRHFLQQSEYTICGRFDNGEWHFHPHDQIVGRNMHQDVLWRIDLPSKTSRDALRLLDQYNLNAFSLFGSEESLLETLWSR